MAWQPRSLLSILVALVMVMGLGMGIGYTTQRVRLRPQTPAEPAAENEVKPAGSRGPAEPLGVPVIKPETRVLVRTTYLKCDQTLEETVEADAALVGLSLEALRRFRPEWTVLDFTPDQVVVRVIRDDWCPGTDPAEMERYRTIGLQEGRVTVFWGRPQPGQPPGQPGQPVKEVTTFPADVLQAQDRASLENGYVVEGDEAVAQYLEGLAE